jgi:ADP-heptose:LPS heptosyltransferase
VADALVRQGLPVCLTGSTAERSLTRAVASAMQMPSLDLCGQTTLWTLGALVEGAALVLCNDTGISHIAAALSTPSVVVSSGGDARRWAPGDTTRHRVLWQDLPCRPCALTHCPIGHPCARGVQVSDVRRAAQQTLRTSTQAAAAA